MQTMKWSKCQIKQKLTIYPSSIYKTMYNGKDHTMCRSNKAKTVPYKGQIM